MRLGEIKSILDKKLTAERKIPLVTAAQPQMGNQYYNVVNFNDLIYIEQFITDLGINDLNRATFEKFVADKQSIISMQFFQQIQQYITQLNAKILFYYKILEKIVVSQDQHIINIKLPDKDLSFKDMEKLIKEFNIIFQGVAEATNIPAAFNIVGVDSGSKWLEVKIIAPIGLFAVVMGAMELSTNLFNIREAYYKSEEAKLSYEVMVAKYKEEITFEKHVEEMAKQKQSDAIKCLLKDNEIKLNNAESQMDIVVSNITKVLKNGVEFHPSLNPPEYINDDSDVFHFDYTKFKEIQKQNAEAKQIESSKESEQNNAE